MDKIGLTTVTFRNLKLEQICKLAYKNHIQNIEWGADVHLPPNDPCALKNALHLKREFNLESLSYGTYYRLGDCNFELWEQITDIAAKINAKIIRVWMGTKASRDTSAREFNQMVDETKTLARIASKKNLTVAFEFHKNTYNDSAESCIRFLKSVNCSNVKTYWQPFSFDNDADVLKKILPYVVCVHVFQWDAEYNRFPLADGAEQWKRFIDIIRTQKSDMNYIMEFVKDDQPEQFTADCNTLKSLLA